jgi:hypothetical protein
MMRRISLVNSEVNLQESIDLHMQNTKDGILLLSHQLGHVRNNLLEGRLKHNRPGNGHFFNIICGRGKDGKVSPLKARVQEYLNVQQYEFVHLHETGNLLVRFPI